MKTQKLLAGLTHLTLAVIAFQIGLFNSFHRNEKVRKHDYQCRHAPRWVDSLRSAPRGTELYSPTLIPSSLTKLVVGLSTVDIHSFLNQFRFGFPLFSWDDPKYTKFDDKWKQVLFLYLHPSSLPSRSAAAGAGTSRNQTATRKSSKRGSAAAAAAAEIPQHADARNATVRCREVKHIVTHIGTVRNRQLHTCIALAGASIGSESYIMNKWIRNNDDLQQGHKLPITHRQVSRYHFATAYKTWVGWLTVTPMPKTSRTALKVLHDYLGGFDDALLKLKPIADKVANHPGDNTAVSVRGNLIVLVCNFGHAELFMNFVCAARAAGLNLNKILLIATDVDMYALAQSLGIAAFHDAAIFRSIPRDASGLYGDEVYGTIMMSKVYAVHLVSQLGYNILFQDVDIVIYKANYLEWFVQKAASGDYDIYFQHDFNERSEYSPWIANSGCYYAINNARTRYLFAEMVYQGDKVITTKSHQAALHTVLSEQASQFGLRIKTLREDYELFPIGWHFHLNREFMREMISHAKSKQMSIHMNWIMDKETKRKFSEQMGDWYLQDTCAGNATLTDIQKQIAAAADSDEVNGTSTTTTETTSLMSTCCSLKPLVRCYWRDKPSVIPCQTSPAYVANAESFW